jgi:hypothetical protein
MGFRPSRPNDSTPSGSKGFFSSLSRSVGFTCGILFSSGEGEGALSRVLPGYESPSWTHPEEDRVSLASKWVTTSLTETPNRLESRKDVGSLPSAVSIDEGTFRNLPLDAILTTTVVAGWRGVPSASGRILQLADQLRRHARS